MVVRVAGDENMAVAAAQRVGVKVRHAPVVQLNASVLNVQVIHVGATAGGRQQVVKGFLMLLAIFQPGDVNAFTSALDPASLRLQAQCQLFSKHALRIVTDFLVPQAAKSTADPEQPNPDRKSVV